MHQEVPTELLVKVLQLLDHRDILRCRMVEKLFKDIIDSTPQIQYKLELAVAYCTDNTNSDLAVTEKLRLLREFQASRKRARFGLGASLTYDYEWAYVGNVLYRDFDFRSLNLSETGLLVTRSWTVDPGIPEFFLLETVLDPAEDLVVCLGIAKSNLLLHIMTLSTGVPFPNHPVTVVDPQVEDVQVMLRIRGHLVAVVFVGILSSSLDDGSAGRGDPAYSTIVNIYDIRTGALQTIVACSSGLEHSNARDLFAFISHSSFVIGSYVGGNYSLKLHALDDGTTTRTSGEALASRHVATFHFPPIQLGAFTTGWLLDESTNGALGSSNPFETIPDSPILAIKRVYMHDDRQRRDDRNTCVFVVPLTVFLSEIGAYKMHRREESAPRDIPWHAWGPMSTRCISVANDILTNPEASLTCHGFRLLVHEPHSSILLDFNPLDIARDLKQHDQHTGSIGRREDDVTVDPYLGRIIQYPTTIARGFFSDDVMTSLPYRETKVNWVGERPSRIVDGNPSLTVKGELSGHGGLHISEYRVLAINP